MSIKSSAVLMGILFAAVFTISQKALTQTTDTVSNGNAGKPSPPIPHRPYLIKKLLYQITEVNRKLQAGVVVQCRCSNDWWWNFKETEKALMDDSASDSKSHWSATPRYKKTVRGYGYNMKDAKWDAMQACGPIAVPIEEESPPEVGPTQDGSKVTADGDSTDGIDMDDDSIMESAFMWCHHSRRFIHH